MAKIMSTAMSVGETDAEIAPCPFCQSEVEHIMGPSYAMSGYQVRCFECHACGPRCEHIDLAIQEWNGYYETK